MTKDKQKRMLDWAIVITLSILLGFEMGNNQWIRAIENALFLISYLLCMKTYRECDMYRQYWQASMDIIEALEKKNEGGEK